jgi:alkaline phosphatase D
MNMTVFTRRALLSGGTLAGAGLLLGTGHASAQTQWIADRPRFITSPFQLGVASGDPAADGFVIWTRLAPEPLQPNAGMIMIPVRVGWEVAADEAFRDIAARGETIAYPELAHAVHVEVAGLCPDRPYWYRFHCGLETSKPGRSRTLPLPGAPKERVRFAVAGCQHYEQGLFTAWRCISREPIDFIFHYGDYIYEGRDSGPGLTPAGRRHVGDEIYSLDDYRRRYALYKLDRDLQAAHAAAPWFVTFDDHEVDDDWAGDYDQHGTPVELFRMRRTVAMQAFYEHMPLRRSSIPIGGAMQLYRRAHFGDLIDAHFLDTRQYRSDQVKGGREAPMSAEAASSRRTMLGARQERWLLDGLARGQGRWQLIAQQVMLMQLAQMRPGETTARFSMDQWPGYLHSRERLLEHIADRRLTNVVTVSGDAHRHFAGDVLRADGKGPALASEFLATSISSGSDGVGDDDDHRRVFYGNACLRASVDRRGYVLCDVGRDHFRGDLMVLDRVLTPNGTLSKFASFVTEHGRAGLELA